MFEAKPFMDVRLLAVGVLFAYVRFMRDVKIKKGKTEEFAMVRCVYIEPMV